MCDDNRLSEYNAIVLPENINTEAYRKVSETLLTRPGVEISLYCNGPGGSAPDGFAIIDMIRAHGNVTGHLVGAALSMHGIIWAACNRRVFYKHSILGVHRASYHFIGSADATSLAQLTTEIGTYDEYGAQVLSSASNKTVAYWRKRVNRAESMSCDFINARELLELGMGELK